MSAYYATGGPATATEQPTLAPVLVAFAGSAPQSRLTVLVRYFLDGLPGARRAVLGRLRREHGVGHGNGVSAANAANQVEADAIPVTNAVNNYAAGVKACNGQLACVTKLDRQVAATFDTFAGQLRTIPMPSQATAANSGPGLVGLAYGEHLRPPRCGHLGHPVRQHCHRGQPEPGA